MAARIADDRGETLLETLIATVLLGLAVVAVIGSLLAAVQLSDVHRKQANAGAVARDYAETVTRYVAAGGYVPCAAGTAYLPAKVGFPSPTGYTATTTVRYWTGSAWTSTCSTDIGLQLATVQARSVDGRAAEELAVVLRKPCGQGSTC
jgi:type II secretory pathway pseudopilin PulG